MLRIKTFPYFVALIMSTWSSYGFSQLSEKELEACEDFGLYNELAYAFRQNDPSLVQAIKNVRDTNKKFRMYPSYFEDILTELYNSPRVGGTNDEINKAAKEFGLKKESECVIYYSKK